MITDLFCYTKMIKSMMFGGIYVYFIFNIYGLVAIILLMIPNIIFSFRFKNDENRFENPVISITEQVGRYGSIALMILNIGFSETGFAGEKERTVWLASAAAMILLYYLFWIFFFGKQVIQNAMVLALVPSALFIVSALSMRSVFLMAFALIFAFSHCYITYKSYHGKKQNDKRET